MSLPGVGLKTAACVLLFGLILWAHRSVKHSVLYASAVHFRTVAHRPSNCNSLFRTEGRMKSPQSIVDHPMKFLSLAQGQRRSPLHVSQDLHFLKPPLG